MAFDPIDSGQIEAGDPVTQELFQKTKDNFDDHESRLVIVEAATGSFDPIPFDILGRIGNLNAPKLDLMKFRVVFDATILAARLVVYEAGTAGSIEVDVRKKPLAGSYTTIFSTRPSVAFGAGSDAVSTNAVLSDTSLSAGDILTLDLTAIQIGMGSASLYLEIEAA